MSRLGKFLPAIISIILLIVIAGYAPWGEVVDIVSGASIQVVISLILLSVCFYSTKIYRYWYMLKVLQIPQPLGAVTLTYLAAQPVTLLPAGELYRSQVLKKYRHIPIRKSVPTFSAQGIFEGLGMALLGLIAALLLGIQQMPVLVLLTLTILATMAIRAGWLERLGQPLRVVPFIHLNKERIQSFSKRNQALFSGKAFFVLLGLSLLTELCGVAIAYVAVNGLGGSINFFQAALVYIIPIIVGFMSLLPGGFGAVEQSSIGLFILIGESTALAVAATLVIRIALTGSGLVYSMIAWPILRHQKPAPYHKERT